MTVLMVRLADGTDRPATPDEIEQLRTLTRGAARGVVAEERARAERDRSVIAHWITKCAALERRVAELEAQLEHTNTREG